MHSSAAGGTTFGVLILEVIVLIFLFLLPLWRILSKAGKPGWGSIVPIYNIYLICKVCGRPGWWTILCLIPFINIIIAIILCIDLAKVFGKDAGFAIGIILLGFIFIPILGYGKTEYKGTAQSTGA
jgi:hypothetical protein